MTFLRTFLQFAIEIILKFDQNPIEILTTLNGHSNEILQKLLQNCIETLTQSKRAWVPKPCQMQVPTLSDSLVCHASIDCIRSTF